MEKDDVNIKASATTVRLVEGASETENGKLWEYHGEGYLPLGAMKLRALTKEAAINEFRYALEDFGYHENDNEDPGDDVEQDSCNACDTGTHTCCHDCG